MYVGKDFDPSDTGEAETYGFDYGAILAAGETIASVVWTCAVISGSDSIPMSRLNGSPNIIASPSTGAASAATTQSVSTMLPGVQYRLQALVTTSLGQKLSLWSHVQCNAPT